MDQQPDLGRSLWRAFTVFLVVGGIAAIIYAATTIASRNRHSERSLSEPQIARLAPKLRALGPRTIRVAWLLSKAESARYSRELVGLFHAAGWDALPSPVQMGLDPTSTLGLAVVATTRNEEVAESILSILREEDIPAESRIMPREGDLLALHVSAIP